MEAAADVSAAVNNKALAQTGVKGSSRDPCIGLLLVVVRVFFIARGNKALGCPLADVSSIGHEAVVHAEHPYA